jgi:hypothetical protein
MNDVMFVKCSGFTISFGPNMDDSACVKRSSDHLAVTEFALSALCGTVFEAYENSPHF